MSATWNRAQEFGQPLTLIVIGVSKSGSRRSSSARRSRPGPSSRRSPACRTRCRCRPWCRGGTRWVGPAGRARPVPRPARRRRRGDVQEHQALLGGGADPAAAEPVGEVGDLASAPCRWCARTPWCDADGEPAVRLRGDADVVAVRPASGAGAGPSGSLRVQVLLLQHLAELLGAPVGHQELHPGVVARAAVAVVAEEPATPAQTSAHLVGPDEDARAAGRTSGWWTGRRRPTGRSPARRRRRCTPTKATSLISWLVQCCGAAGDRGLELAGQVGERRVAEVAVDGLGAAPAGVERPRRRRRLRAGSRASPAGCRRRPRWWTARPLRAAARSRGRPRSGSSAAGRSAGR